MATKKAEKKAAPKAEKKAAAVSEPVKETAAPLPKNAVKLETGEIISVRGPEKFRANYQAGNVGWQDFLRSCRLALNVATYLTKIGAGDALVKKYFDKASAEMQALDAKRVRVPSDMVTQYAALQNLGEVPVGTPDYIFAIRKLAGLAKAVDVSEQGNILSEVVSARAVMMGLPGTGK